MYKSALDHEEWDRFVAKCGCSYRCLFKAHWLSNSSRSILFSIKRFDIVLKEGPTEIKIGQFAIIMTKDTRIFTDQLQLLPSWGHMWATIMRAILAILGPGRYRYGSEWMTGPCRVEALKGTPDVKVSNIKYAKLEVVDFSCWTSWNEYWGSISKNVIRSYNKYVRECDSQGLMILDIRRFWKYHVEIINLKSLTLISKGVASSKVKIFVKSVLRYIALANHLKFVICVAPSGRLDSFAACVSIGINTYYMEGGSFKSKRGSGWFTLVNAIRQAYHGSNGTGLFIMGPVDDATSGSPRWLGLEQSRQQCRIVQRAVSTIDFEFRYSE
ncbi:hypothetical protein [Methylobacterium sp. J-077]|uniref:hypothetical protein n=1 Tax=Methylobacterium sp. J-077 TaxID=2836656 RepID=UPI001FBA34B4|nr:hypothetical protein [Methylobacterium sp. J-077]MCJ2122085.1 hypothetical protein [Methylobacterium sp. J-077]